MKRVVIWWALGLAAIATVPDARAQWPGNRQLHTISVAPAPAGTEGQIVTAYWSVDLEASGTPLDYSTSVRLLLNGSLITAITESVTLDGGSGTCSDDPPCGGSCGTGEVNGEDVTLICYKDNCGAVGCDCDCGIWISTEFPPADIRAGDLVEVEVVPTAGAAADNDDSDNGVSEPYHGQPIGWNRRIEDAQVVSNGEGAYDIEVSGTISWEGLATMLNLDATVDLVVNGTVIASSNIPAETTQIYDQSCFTSGCGNACGSFNGIPSYCDPFLWWTCGCGSGWITLFPGVGLSTGDEIMILLRPAPGALPTLPGFGEDDEYELVCCGSSDVIDGDGGPRSPETLGPSHPNPFGSETTIRFELPQSGRVRLDILDASGRIVATVLDRSLRSGPWSVTWDGRTSSGDLAVSGAYFYRLETGQGVLSRRMTLLR